MWQGMPGETSDVDVGWDPAELPAGTRARAGSEGLRLGLGVSRDENVM